MNYDYHFSRRDGDENYITPDHVVNTGDVNFVGGGNATMSTLRDNNANVTKRHSNVYFAIKRHVDNVLLVLMYVRFKYIFICTI
jgi:hypothetical protein